MHDPTIFYGDYYSGDAGIDLTDTVAACIKATQGNHYQNPAYRETVNEANRAGAYVFAYHYLEHGSPESQATWYVKTQNHGKRPLMVDIEKVPDSPDPQIDDLKRFVREVRTLGGVVHLVYLPHWYWQDHLHSPDLTWMRDMNLRLVSSNYSEPYSLRGVGWQPYGGMFPQIWQYTDKFNMHGRIVDFNAFRGSVDELRSLCEHGTLPAFQAT